MAEAKYLPDSVTRGLVRTRWQENESVRLIILACAEAWDVGPGHLLSSSRNQTYVKARQAAQLIARTLTDCSYPELGRLFRRDHTTVIASCRKAAKRLASDDLFRERFLKAMAKVEGGG